MFLQKPAYIIWLHVQDFSNLPLHNQKVWIVDIELHWTKQILNLFILHCWPIYHVFALAPQDNLSGDCDFWHILKTRWTLLWVIIVKSDRHCSFIYATLATLVDQIL